MSEVEGAIAGIVRRLDEITANQQLLMGKQDKMSGSVTAILAELGGAPDPTYRDRDRPTIRHRLHDLENTKHAAAAAGAALGLLFGRITRWGIVIGIVIAAVGTLLRLFGVGGG